MKKKTLARLNPWKIEYSRGVRMASAGNIQSKIPVEGVRTTSAGNTQPKIPVEGGRTPLAYPISQGSAASEFCILLASHF